MDRSPPDRASDRAAEPVPGLPRNRRVGKVQKALFRHQATALALSHSRLEGEHEMLTRLALIVCALCVLQAAVAADTAPSNAPINTCRESQPSIHELWRHDLYDTQPAVAAVMDDAIDGKLLQVRQGLATLPPDEQAHWRQVAMVTAANTYQPTVVDGLLDDGAAADDPARLPLFKNSFEHQVENTMAQNPLMGRNAVKGFKAAGVMRNDGSDVGPALIAAANCDDLATLDVLLRHHANVAVRSTPPLEPDIPRASYALLIAVVQDYADITQHLLDHDADVCASNRLIRKPGATLASIGERNHFPDALIRRLTCPATAPLWRKA